MIAVDLPPPALEAFNQALRIPPPAYEQVLVPALPAEAERKLDEWNLLVGGLERIARDQLAFLNAGIKTLTSVVAAGGKAGTPEQFKNTLALCSTAIATAKNTVDDLKPGAERTLRVILRTPLQPRGKRLIDRLMAAATGFHDGLVRIYYQLAALAAECDPDAEVIVATASTSAEIDAFFDSLKA